ncbi:MAG: hypothetical protein EBR30_23545 [Cytophagia bacterium]|nr:hypothetical protein [Cytophagia bacterium]
MADFSLTTLFVVPVGQTSLPSSGSTQNLTAGQVGFFKNDYSVATAGNIAAAPYFYVAQGRQNTYLQGSKRSDKIKGCPSGSGCSSNVTEWYKVSGCGTPAVQITDVTDWSVQCGEVVTLTLRAHSSYLDTLYFNGFTRSVTVQAPCCDCGADPCTDVDTNELINQFIYQLNLAAPGNNPDNITFSDFYTFENVGGTILRISGKPLTKYGQPCDIAAFPWEYDRMYFRTFVYPGPATTADFIVADNCNIVANPIVVQRASYPTGTAEEIAQLEKNFYSYQAGYLKHLYRMNGYNENFESYVSTGVIYDSYYIKFNQFDKSAYQWGDYIYEDSMVIIAVPNADTPGNAGIAAAVEAVLEAALGTVVDNNACITTTTTTTATPPTTTTTTSTLIP